MEVSGTSDGIFVNMLIRRYSLPSHINNGCQENDKVSQEALLPRRGLVMFTTKCFVDKDNKGTEDWKLRYV